MREAEPLNESDSESPVSETGGGDIEMNQSTSVLTSPPQDEVTSPPQDEVTSPSQEVTSEVLDEADVISAEPTEEDRLEFASFLELDLISESHLAWIVHEGLTCPTPKGWKPCRSPEGETYFFNFQTGESLWDHPCDEAFKNLYEAERIEPR